MPSTKRRLDPRLPGALVLVVLASGAGTSLASCASDRDILIGSELADAALQAPDRSDTADEGDRPDGAAPSEAGPPRLDAARSDAGPLPVVCASSSCAISLDSTHTFVNSEGYCALLHDGTVACWGSNQEGQLGRGNAGIPNSAMPARVQGLTNVVAIDHTCAIDGDGATWCWGRGPYLRDATTSLTTEHLPVQVAIPPATAVGVHARPFFAPNLETGTACAVVDGGVLCWGMNEFAQVAPIEDPLADPKAPSPPHAIALPDGAKVRSVRVGYASFVLREDGTLLSWGATPPLGRVSSLLRDPTPKPVALTGVSNVDVRDDGACAVAEGIAYCWGGYLGGGMPEEPPDNFLPKPVPMPEPVVQISTTNNAVPGARQRGCACGVSGDVYCWGNNDWGQLGDGTTNATLTPVKVVGLPAPAAEVRTLDRSTCALLTTGRVYCWGYDHQGQLGGGTVKSPTRVPREVVLP